MRAVPVDKAGVGSAVLNSARQVGGSIGIALMGAIVAARRSATGSSPNAAPIAARQFVDGFSNALIVAGVIAFAGAVVAAVLVRARGARGAAAPPVPSSASPTWSGSTRLRVGGTRQVARPSQVPPYPVAQLEAATFHDDGPRAWLCGPATPSGLRRKVSLASFRSWR